MLELHIERARKAAPCTCCTYPDCMLYNEVLQDAAVWTRRMPSTIEAFYYVADEQRRGLSSRGPSGERQARWAHRLFLARFGLSAAEVPLLKLELENGPAPFSLDGPLPAASAPALASTMRVSTITARVNSRFTGGRPSKSLAETGVLVHQWDSTWWTTTGAAARPCASMDRCDRASASIISSRAPFLFSDKRMGLIIQPESVRVLCAYAGDGGTARRKCSPTSMTCIPGCWAAGTDAGPAWCAGSSCGGPWKGTQLDSMLRVHEARGGRAAGFCWIKQKFEPQHAGCKYNEVILEKASWVRNLPTTIEAFFVVEQSYQRDSALGGTWIDFARQRRLEFVRRYPTANAVPLLLYSQREAEAGGQPFTEVPL